MLVSLNSGKTGKAMSISIREARPADAEVIYNMIYELAVYEKAPQEVVTSPQEIRETLFGAQSKTEALICEADGVTIGYAVFFTSYSTWLGRNGIYLEDLYVSPDARGQGAGKALIKHIARLAVQRKCGRLEWSVLDWNQPAIDFYLSIGALPQSEWVRYRLDGEALLNFAER
jgi:GNAT superfamily N-acetyltransferase